LQPLGLYIQPYLRVLICSACETAVLPSSVVRHFGDLHTTAHPPINANNIASVASAYNLRHDMPIIKGPVPQIAGLPVFTRHQKCPECQGIYSKSSLPVHWSNIHSGIPTPNFASLPMITAQRLNKGTFKSLFEVIVPIIKPPTPPSTTIVESLRQAREKLVPEYFHKTLDARAIGPWMEFTGWHAHVQPFDTNELSMLVEYPQKQESLYRLVAAITSIFDRAYEYMDRTNTIVLQRIKTDDLHGWCVNY
jgi:hypothetical protein